MTDPQTIVVINPNSSERISEQIREAVADDAGSVIVLTSTSGPRAIETDADVEAAIEPMLATAAARNAAAYVIACFSDPGLDDLRAASEVPVYGIAESAMRVAMTRGHRIGIISSVADSLPRHARYWDKLGITARVAADVALGLGVLELDTEQAYGSALAAGRQLLAAGADVIVLGCTGMTHMESRLSSELAVPIVDPCRAAVELARNALEETK